jgi:hypothetical protein
MCPHVVTLPRRALPYSRPAPADLVNEATGSGLCGRTLPPHRDPQPPEDVERPRSSQVALEMASTASRRPAPAVPATRHGR